MNYLLKGLRKNKANSPNGRRWAGARDLCLAWQATRLRASVVAMHVKQTQFRGSVSREPRTCRAKQSQLPGSRRLRPDGPIVQNKANCPDGGPFEGRTGWQSGRQLIDYDFQGDRWMSDSISLDDILGCRDPAVYNVATRAAGPAGELPLAGDLPRPCAERRPFRPDPGRGDGVEVCPRSSRDAFLLFSHQGGIRGADGTTCRPGLSRRALRDRPAHGSGGAGVPDPRLHALRGLLHGPL